jgi:hypothetical protein
LDTRRITPTGAAQATSNHLLSGCPQWVMTKSQSHKQHSHKTIQNKCSAYFLQHLTNGYKGSVNESLHLLDKHLELRFQPNQIALVNQQPFGQEYQKEYQQFLTSFGYAS